MPLVIDAPPPPPEFCSAPRGLRAEGDVGRPHRHRRGPRWLPVALAAAIGCAAVLGGGLWANGSTKGGDPRVEAVAAALDLRPGEVHATAWRFRPGLSGTRIAADVSGVGLVELNATSNELDQVIYDHRLGTPAGTLVGESAALATGTRFAARHFNGFGGLAHRSTEFIDHGSFAEYRITWQARQGQAWLPTQNVAGVNARTGEIAYFWSDRVAATAGTVPRVTAAAARDTAVRVARLGSKAQASLPVLEVTLTPSGQRLVWAVSVHPRASSQPHIARAAIAWIDAQTGEAVLQATT